MRWMEIAWAEQGVAEVSGAGNNGTILGYFREVGRDDITSDATAWCAAFVGACLARAGIKSGIPKGKELLARSFLKVGQPIDGPRVGAIVVLTRGDPQSWTAHVGLVVGWTRTHVAVLSGNQSNAVNVQHFPLDQVIGWRWPEAIDAGALEARGSRTMTAAKQAARDGGKAGGIGATPAVMPAELPDMGLKEAAEHAGSLKSQLMALSEFAAFLHGKWFAVAAILACFFAARVVWRQGLIRAWRLEDHNHGANPARSGDAINADAG